MQNKTRNKKLIYGLKLTSLMIAMALLGTFGFETFALFSQIKKKEFQLELMATVKNFEIVRDVTKRNYIIYDLYLHTHEYPKKIFSFEPGDMDVLERRVKSVQLDRPIKLLVYRPEFESSVKTAVNGIALIQDGKTLNDPRNAISNAYNDKALPAMVVVLLMTLCGVFLLLLLIQGPNKTIIEN